MVSIELYNGDALTILPQLTRGSVKLVFADPPYNLSGQSNLTCKSGTVAVCDKGNWDKIENIHEFNREWVKQCTDVLSDDGTIWISGTRYALSVQVLSLRLRLYQRKNNSSCWLGIRVHIPAPASAS